MQRLSSESQNVKNTTWLRKRWDWLARYYDHTHLRPEWRQRLCEQARGLTLEVGAGTGLNLPYYPADLELVVTDLSGGMLARARARAAQLKLRPTILEMDLQHLDFPDGLFDTVIATCVFCTVPDPVRGLAEVRRVCKPGGRILLLEHVRSGQPMIGRLMDLANPVLRSLTGTNINRETLDNIRTAGMDIVSVQPVWRDIMLEIHASPNKPVKASVPHATQKSRSRAPSSGSR